MERKKMLSAAIVSAAALVVTALAVWGVHKRSEAPPAGATGAGHAEDDGHGHAGHGHEGHGDAEQARAEGKKSDLDRPVAEMWTETCEHGVLQYSCDGCRFEIGTVKLASDLVGEKGKPGLVGVGAAGSRMLAESRSFTGEVRLSEGRTVRVTSPLSGVLRKVHADAGSQVREGDVLFEIDSHEAADAKSDYLKKVSVRDLARKTAEREAALFAKKIAAEAEVLEARAKLSEAEIELASARGKLRRFGVPEEEVARLEGKSADAVTGYLPVRAPRSGVVLEKHGNAGEHVEPGKELYLLSDLSEVWVFADVREGDLPLVAKRANGNGRIPAEVRASGGRAHKGTMDLLPGTMNEQTRTVKARIVVPNPDGHLRPGMFVTIRLLLEGGGNVLAVPKAAVLADEGRMFVFVHKEGEYWVRRPVTPGRRVGEMVEIVSGLSPGQRIIADGSFLLKSDVLRGKMGAGCAD